MGYRLEGPRLEFREESDILSEPMSSGSVQVPGNGQPILLLADSQSTGGYYRIATVIGVDLPLAAQSQPGEKVRFKQVSEKEAIRSLMYEKKMFDEISIYIESSSREDISSRYRVRVNDRHFLVQVENS